MISRIRKSIPLAAGDQRVAARMVLAVVVAVVCLALVLAGASMGLTGSVALSQPSPSGSPSGSPGADGPQIFLLNPNPTYDPHLTVTEPPREPSDPMEPTADPDVPKISDEFDGVDEAYHVVAVVKDPPPNLLIEAYYAASGQNEVTVGQLSPVPGSDDTYEFFWDISEATLNPGFGTFAVRLFQQTASGFDEVAAHEVPVRLQHETSTPTSNLGEPTIEEAETIELAWPSQNGPLGFYKPSGPGAVWRTLINGTTSAGVVGASTDQAGQQGNRNVYQVRLFYSVTPIGELPEYVPCGTTTDVSGAREDATRTFAGICTLTGSHLPSDVQAVAAMAIQDQDPDRIAGDTNTRQPSQEGVDAHRVQPYVPDPAELKIDVSSNSTTDQPTRRHEGTRNRCLAYLVTVTDVFDRPIFGANLDIHMVGPDDQIRFGDDDTTGSSGSQSGTYAVPGKGHPSKELAANCDATIGGNEGEQGDHNVPGGNDVKHRESVTGSGIGGGAATTYGQWRFHLLSGTLGDTDLTVWIDDESLPAEADKRPEDDDVLEDGEPRETNFAQWLPSAPAVTIDPTGATAAAGECQRFVVRVRSGNRAVRDANVDVHAAGPDNELDFCDPSDASPRAAPDGGTGHNAEDVGEVAHAGQPPVAQHTEGNTNDQGNFVVGLRSPVPGDTTLTAWYDSGEAPFDNDEQATGEATATATTNWVESTGDAALSFLNPSPYGSAGTNVGKKQDVDTAFHIVTRVSSVVPVPGVEVFYRGSSNELVKIGDATQVNQTDTYETYWTVDVADASYTLVARIPGTPVTAEQSITVNNATTPTNPADVPFETVEITAPLDGQRASFVRGKLPIRGVASAGADGVTLYYTRASSVATPGSGAWTQCGTSNLASSSAPKEFTLDCTLQGSDQPSMVTGVAALVNDCTQGNCTIGRTNHSGDAHRVFGAEANPLLSIEPAETAANTGTCQKFVVSLQDQTGQPIGGENLDAHLTGPGNSGNFCSPDDGTGTNRRAPDAGGHIADGDETDEAYHDEGGTRVHHTEAESTSNGRFVLGIESQTTGDAQLTVWFDQDGDDLVSDGEVNDISVMHWEAQGVCDITGTNGPDNLTGGDEPEKICGFGGNDTITGGGGNDTILGGGGADTLRGNAANDVVRGGAGRDFVFGGGGSDRVFGGGDGDRVKGHRGNDRVRGNTGPDRLDGGGGRDDCLGGKGRDRLRRCERGSRSFAARPRLI
ncbi:MAG TPA: calcium-binding protein [Actinomycetota bacterium]|nr:calcium-binding protein [Actinomycetota bacterium]